MKNPQGSPAVMAAPASTSLNAKTAHSIPDGRMIFKSSYANAAPVHAAAHSSGKGAKYTRGRGPLQPVYIEYLPDKITAARREAAIKKLPRERKIALLKETTNSLNSSPR